MTKPQITVYGAHWCPDCRRSRQFLGEHQIPYNWIDIEEDSAGEKYVLDVNQGKRLVPTISFDDGTVLTVPSNAELAKKLGLKTTAERRHYDLIVVGGGPAGLTTAMYTAREGIDTLVIEQSSFGGQAATTMHLDNVPGFPEGISGAELASRFRAQVERFGVELVQTQKVDRVQSEGPYHRIRTTDEAEYSALAIVLAPGSLYRRLDVPGEEEFLGAGVHFCATCDGPFYKGMSVAVVGGGNSAAEESLFLTRFAERVTLLVRSGSLRASQTIEDKVLDHPQIDLRFNTVVESFEGAESKLLGMCVRNTETEETTDLALPGAFIFIGLDPATEFLKDGPVRLDNHGFILTGRALVHDGSQPSVIEASERALLETSVPGIFAAGDARADSTKQVASAAGEGAAVALMVRGYLRKTQ